MDLNNYESTLEASSVDEQILKLPNIYVKHLVLVERDVHHVFDNIGFDVRHIT